MERPEVQRHDRSQPQGGLGVGGGGRKEATLPVLVQAQGMGRKQSHELISS